MPQCECRFYCRQYLRVWILVILSTWSAAALRMPTLRSLKTAEVLQDERSRAERLMRFIDHSPEPFHVVESVIDSLRAQGFEGLREEDNWVLKPGGKYYFTRNRSSILAFALGGKYSPHEGNAFKVIGAHTDSPTLKIKPRSKRPTAAGLCQVSVETYGGGLWHTWFDRDLSLAGRVIVREGSGFKSRLVKCNKAVLRVPNLAIHLRTQAERDSFTVNKEDHVQPILCEEVAKALSTPSDKDEENDQWASEQQPELLQLLAKELSVEMGDILDFELSVYDLQKASFSGANDEFVVSSRIDNLASCFTALESLNEYAASDAMKEDTEVSVIALFDHEEVGSESNPGAGSNLMGECVRRICSAFQCSDLSSSIAKSLVLSVDMAHALHPNYLGKHDKQHSPMLNRGVVIKHNSNQRYATNGETAFIIRELARGEGVPVQEFIVRNDCPCGTTIGPIISSNTGMRAIDLGMPQLSMHSIREMMGASDLTFATRLFTSFFQGKHTAIDNQLRQSTR